uniref:FYVE-type domain-containing protein n=1 Tax=Kwoniella dejecticola CBS 10117 TaxID=1296121 RepID=A0A1A6A852_9TREE|nr:uncharacterized protein I303_03955 [Kwoniella dejecticola CBS 10117]OBR86235.1 hypothetical protein I303_03955 [Kwoniella dejecticola CBS 10117]
MSGYTVSGPPPVIESSNCRQCNKEFNFIFRRKHVCGHCGYEYCSNCLSDGQALMPRKAGQGSSSSTNPSSNGPGSIFSEIKEGLREGLGLDEKSNNVGSGYEVESVCLPCLSMLQVTAANLTQLRALPIKRLKEYLAAYNIPCVGPKEKEDFVQAVIRARNPSTGCLSHEAESYYRRRSVPKSGKPPTSSSTTPTPSTTPRPRPAPQTYTQARPPPTSPYNTHARPPPPQGYHARPPPPQQSYRPPPPNNTPRPAQPTPRPAQARSTPAVPRSQASPAPPPPPVPTILSLVSLPRSYLASLSIGTLKAILYENHVRVDFKQVLEKEQLIDRVNELIVDERKRLERQRIEEERLANPVSAPNGTPTPLSEDKETSQDDETGANGDGETATQNKKVPTGPPPEIDRGLCVVCQDEEATLAVVDCGLLGFDHGHKPRMSSVPNEDRHFPSTHSYL